MLAQSATENTGQDNSQPALIIKSIEGPQEQVHNINKSGVQIGRHSSNQIVIFDESVSRFHA